ncbi:MAG TPA: aminopeptidase [Planctomycetota bacterium]|nr:aminopeptidase [Planctomycetota bacterium]
MAGCQSGYLLKQGLGQLRLKDDEVPLDSTELSKRISASDSEKLRWVPRILDFCRDGLGLEPGDSYTSYVDTRGKPVSYAVTAAHPLALIPFEWRFPFVGRVPYKGYFDEDAAREEAERLTARGFETRVVSVGAYSTLGWFRDPIFTSMLEGTLADLVDVIIHETTHRTRYFPGSVSFNESLATHIARQGTERFLAAHDDLRADLPEYRARRRAAMERETLLLRLRNDLDALYRAPVEDGAKLRRKAELFATASEAYRQLVGCADKASLPATNAFVLSLSRYHEFEPLLARLQESLGGDPADLMKYLKELPRSINPVPAIEEILSQRGP